MNILPITTVTYKTQLSIKEVIEKLNDCVEPKKGFSLLSGGAGRGKLYEGEISGQTFEVSRIISYRNTFLPVITGNIQQENNATIIEINMRLNKFVSAFLLIWCVIFAFAVILLITKEVDFFVMFYVMPFVLLLVFFSVFKFEVNKSKKDFQQIFEAEIIEEK